MAGWTQINQTLYGWAKCRGRRRRLFGMKHGTHSYRKEKVFTIFHCTRSVHILAPPLPPRLLSLRLMSSIQHWNISGRSLGTKLQCTLHTYTCTTHVHVPDDPWKRLCIFHGGSIVFLVRWSSGRSGGGGGRGSRAQVKKEVRDPLQRKVLLLRVTQ